jgi:hypothetical protein
VEGSVTGIIPTHPIIIPCGRKLEYPEKTTFGRALTDSFHMTVMHESIARIEPTISEVKGSFSDDCATKASYVHVYIAEALQ